MINEIREQLQHLIDALAADLYHPLGEIMLEGFLAPARSPWKKLKHMPGSPGRPEPPGESPGITHGCSAVSRFRRKPGGNGSSWT